MNDREKALLLINKSSSLKLILHIYSKWDPLCWLKTDSKTVACSESYLYRVYNDFKYRIYKYECQKGEKEELHPAKIYEGRKCYILRQDGKLYTDEIGNYQIETKICIRRSNAESEAPVNGIRDLYAILLLNIYEVRRLPLDEQDQIIKKAFNKEIKRWHTDRAGANGDDDMAHEVLSAYEVLKDRVRRAEYHNQFDFKQGWFSLSKWKAIFCPECENDEQLIEYVKKMVLMAATFGIAVGGIVLTAVTGTAAAPAAFITGKIVGGAMLSAATRTLGRSIQGYPTTKQDSSAADIALTFAAGALAGAATGGADFGISSAITTGIGATIGATIASNAASGAVGGAISSVNDHVEKALVDNEELTAIDVITKATKDVTLGAVKGVAVGSIKYGAKKLAKSSSSSNNEKIAKDVAESTVKEIGKAGFAAVKSEFQTDTMSPSKRNYEKDYRSNPSHAEFMHISGGLWVSKMIIKYTENGTTKVKESKSRKPIFIPRQSVSDVRVSFEIMWFPFVWGPLFKYNRFTDRWIEEYDPGFFSDHWPAQHVFKYDQPPIKRTYTIAGALHSERVIKVTDENFDEVGDM